MTRRLRGFSLIEVALSLVIIGTLMVSLFPLIKGAKSLNRHYIVRERFEKIICCIAQFVLLHNRLPIPCDQGDVRSGYEEGIRGLGFVPFKTLGLEVHDVQDSDGSFFIYQIDTNLIEETQLLGLNVTPSQKDPKRTFCYRRLQGTIDSKNSFQQEGVPIIELRTLDEKRGIKKRVSRELLMSFYAKAPCQALPY